MMMNNKKCTYTHIFIDGPMYICTARIKKSGGYNLKKLSPNFNSFYPWLFIQIKDLTPLPTSKHDNKIIGLSSSGVVSKVGKFFSQRIRNILELGCQMVGIFLNPKSKFGYIFESLGISKSWYFLWPFEIYCDKLVYFYGDWLIYWPFWYIVKEKSGNPVFEKVKHFRLRPQLLL
jgi:hypothetical protein